MLPTSPPWRGWPVSDAKPSAEAMEVARELLVEIGAYSNTDPPPFLQEMFETEALTLALAIDRFAQRRGHEMAAEELRHHHGERAGATERLELRLDCTLCQRIVHHERAAKALEKG